MDGTFVGAVLAGIAGIITSTAAVVRARNRGTKHCEDELRDARAEAERYASELHDERMRRD